MKREMREGGREGGEKCGRGGEGSAERGRGS